MMKKLVGLVIPLFLVMSSLVAEENSFSDLFDEVFSDTGNEQESPGETLPDGETKLQVSFYGEHIAAYFVGLTEGSDFAFSREYLHPSCRNHFGLVVENPGLQIISELDLDIDISGENDLSQSLSILPGNNYLKVYLGALTFYCGMQNYEWGKADIFNPTDLLNQKDYSKGPVANKIPAFGIGLSWFLLSSLSLELVYIPVPGRDLFPVDLAAMLGSNLPGAIVTTESPALLHSESKLGCKLNFFLQYFDASLSYILGRSPYYFPEITLLDMGSQYFPAEVWLRSELAHNIGFNCRIPAGEIGICLEGNFMYMPDYTNEYYTTRNPRLNWITGLDFYFGEAFDHYLNLQYFGQYIHGYDDTFLADYPAMMPPENESEEFYLGFYERMLGGFLDSASEEFLHGGTFHLKFSFFDQSFLPELTLIYFFPVNYADEILVEWMPVAHERLGSLMSNVKLVFSGLEGLQFTLGADCYLAWHRLDGGDIEIDDTDKIGHYFDDSHIFLELKYVWN